MRSHHLPPGLEKEVQEAIVALASCRGLGAVHLQTIRYCIAVCPEGFERAYFAYFEPLTSKETHNSERSNRRSEACLSA